MKKFFLTSIFSLILLISCNLKTSAMEFSADMFTNGKSAGKIFIKGKKTRINTPGNKQYIISRQDKNTTYIIMPAQKMYMEQKFDPKTLPNVGMDSSIPSYKKVFVKSENLNGKKAKKYKITVDDSVSYQWFISNIIFPVKIQDVASGTVIEYKNISMKVQNSVFKLPQGYKKMQIPGMSGMNFSPNMPQMPKKLPNMNQLKDLKKFW